NAQSSKVSCHHRLNRSIARLPEEFVPQPLVYKLSVHWPLTEGGWPMSDALDTADPLALEEQVCFALSVAARGVVGVYRPLLEPMGLTHPQYLVMLALWQHAPLSVRGLSELLQLDPGTLSPLLKRLEASGYLRRERKPG